ncbi:hypothetical protein [Streptomyces coeruleorubidus]|uniref:hypothetical protein n=1 Tax=Streptomyces coeruleorubidus TaxID=116188 RepID=UPI0033DB5B64
MPTSHVDPSGLCTTQLKDLFSGTWGWNTECDKEDRETATLPPASQSAKNLSDKLTNKAIEVTGQTSLGLLDGPTLGGFSHLTGAEVVCPPAYNVGLYGAIILFPSREAASACTEGAKVAGRGLWTLTAQGASKIMKGGPFKTTFYKSKSDGTWWTPHVTGSPSPTANASRTSTPARTTCRRWRPSTAASGRTLTTHRRGSSPDPRLHRPHVGRQRQHDDVRRVEVLRLHALTYATKTA